MPLFPYKVRPVPPLMALLLEDGEHVLCEDGEERALRDLEAGYRVWGSWDTCQRLWGQGIGEALCWQSKMVRWRPFRVPGSWQDLHTDVRVLRLTFPHEPEKAMEGMLAWRDWLVRYGAAPAGSLGSTSKSLLRATLRVPLWTNVGEAPPIPWVLGGRQQLLEGKVGRHEPARHYDLPAAYASALGAMRYGGHWTQVGKGYPYIMAAQRGVLCFVRARVAVPDTLPIGPLPERPKRPPKPSDALWTHQQYRYPTGKTVVGIWTWEEVQAAADAGCKVNVRDVWIHMSPDGRYPFQPWWEAVEQGRGMPEFAGLLAKATGNSLWGQFCITPEAERTVQWWDAEALKRKKRKAQFKGSNVSYAPDLAETLTGRVRADLFRCMLKAGDHLLCAHTDGIWTMGEADGVPQEWRTKYKVARLDLITPQLLRFYRKPPPGGAAEYVMAGVPDTLAPRLFAVAWRGLGRSL